MDDAKTLKNVIIVGAGFSGLTLAALLAATKKFNITVFEKNSPGGFITSEIENEIIFENAAPSLLNHHELENFIAGFGFKISPALKSAQKRFIFSKKLQRWPLGFYESLQLFVNFIRLWFKRNQTSHLQNLSVEKWSELHLGIPFTEKMLRPALFGIYASDISDLSAELVIKRFFEKKNRNRAVVRGSVIPQGGLANFLQHIRNDLQKRNVHFKKQQITTADLSAIEPGTRVVFATSFAGFTELVKPSPQTFLQLENALAADRWLEFTAQIELISLAKVHVVPRTPQNKINGFGILFHPAARFSALGVIANSQVFAEYGPQYNESWILKYTDTEHLLSDVLNDRARLFGFRDEPAWSRVSISKNIYPVYNTHLLNWLNATHFRPGFFATGNYWGALGLTQIFLQNKQLAERLLNDD